MSSFDHQMCLRLLLFSYRCDWKAEAGVYFEQRCCCSSHHFLPTGSPQGQYLGLPCSGSWCRIWKPNVCLSGNGLWGEKNLISLCCLLSCFVPLLFFICLWSQGTLAAFAAWDNFCVSWAYLLFVWPSVRMGKSFLSWWFFLHSCYSTANVHVFFEPFFLHLPASLLLDFILMLFKIVSPCFIPLLIPFLKDTFTCSVLGSRQWSHRRSSSQHTTDIDILWTGPGFEPCC